MTSTPSCRLAACVLLTAWLAVPALAAADAPPPAQAPAAPAAAAPAAPKAADKPAPSVAGDWLGALDVQGQTLHLALHVKKGDDGAFKATLDSLDQGAMGLAVDKVTLDGSTVRVEMPAVNARYEGTLSADGAEMSGTWSQGGGSLPLKFTRGVAKAPEAPKIPPSDPIKPLWMGTLEVPGGKLRLVIHIARAADGVLTVTIDSLDQGANGIKVDSAVFKDGKLTLDLKGLNARFEGTANKDATEVSGTWTQGGAPLPFVIKAIDKMPAVLRPQEPKPPLPYAEEEVSYTSAPSGVKLACTLTTPKTGAPFPAAVLITGSGPEDRNETVFGHRPFLVLADHLTRRGIAVLRCDDRGVGGSSPGPADATSESFADDALAGVAFLKTRKDVDPARIGLVGHSEGGIVAPSAAARSKDIAFIVLLAGPGLPGSDIILAQSALIMKAMGTPQSVIDTMTASSARIFAAIKEEKDPATLEARIRKEVAASPEGLTADMVDQRVKSLVTPWFRYFITHDPRPTLASVTIPVLAVNGERDLQVPAKENTDAIRTALDKSGNKDHTVLVLPGLNHLFQESKTGAPTEYSAIEQTFAPSALTTVSDWILAHTKKPSGTDAPKAASETKAPAKGESALPAMTAPDSAVAPAPAVAVQPTKP